MRKFPHLHPKGFVAQLEDGGCVERIQEHNQPMVGKNVTVKYSAPVVLPDKYPTLCEDLCFII